jgi:hypothetical protein
MNFAEKLKARVESALQHASEEIKAVFAPSEVEEQRYNICLECEHLFTMTNQCKKCGCFVKAKTKLASAKCPIDKWLPVKVE